MKKIFFLFAALMIYFQIVPKTVDEPKSTFEAITRLLPIKTVKKAAGAVAPHLKKYAGCLEPTIAVAAYDFRTPSYINTPMAGVILAQGLSFAVCIPAPHLKVALLAALVGPYATEVCAKTTFSSIVRTTNGDSSPLVLNFAAQNTLLATYGD